MSNLKVEIEVTKSIILQNAEAVAKPIDHDAGESDERVMGDDENRLLDREDSSRI